MAIATHAKRPAHQKKRHGKHQKKTKTFLNTYHPFMPLLVCLLILLVAPLRWWKPVQGTSKGVLAYATDMNSSGLLGATNTQRASDGQPNLVLNTQLSQAAQSKANDMATRNYWSHNTPEGNAPWIFISQAGYSYTQAGENLAYGFLTSDDAIVGWMNSPSHRDNLLKNAYKEVGFGIANSANYQASGPQTIVVAMYGTPQVAGASTAPAPAAPTKLPAPTKTQPTPTPVTTPAPAPAAPQATPATPDTNNPKPQEQISTMSNANTANIKAQPINRLQLLTKGYAPWITSLAIMLGIVAAAHLVTRHWISFRRYVVQGERYIAHHLALDLVLIVIIGLSLIVTANSGSIL